MRRILIGGHPLHPALVHMPVGLLAAVPVMQMVARFADAPTWRVAARVCVELGLIAAVPAAVAGLLDLLAMRAGGRAMAVGILHLSLMVAAVGSYGLAWTTWDRPDHTAFALAVTGLALLLAGAYAGGHLVYVYGVATPSEAPDG